MPTDLSIWLWALGVLCTLVGALMLIILGRVLKQGDDTNAKVTAQGVTLARVETAIASHETRLNSLHDWRNKLQERELADAAAEVSELRARQREVDEERRHFVRREEDRS